MFEREDWKLFRNIETLCQKGGVNKHRIPMLIIKELVDNALDVSKCELKLLTGNGFSVRDFGSGISESLLKDLFSINRPMITSKLLRLPTRGALGNGLRVVIGAIISTNGKLFVETNGKKYQVIFLDNGSADIYYMCDSDITVGTKFDVYLGNNIFRVTEQDLAWGQNAIIMARGKSCACKTSAFWYTSEAFFELLNSYTGTLKELLLLFEGVSVHKVKEHFVDADRFANEVPFQESENILSILKEFTKPVNVNKLGYADDLGNLGEYVKKSGEFTVKSAKGIHDAKIPFIVESWLKIQNEYIPHVYVNKTPITGEYSSWYNKGSMILFRLGLNIDVKLKPSQLIMNVMTPYMPITSDGKSPDFSGMNSKIQECLNTCKNKAKKSYMSLNNDNAKNEKEVIVRNLQSAINKAGSFGRHIFSLRQLYYAVRPYVLDALGKETSYNYFCSIITEYESIYGDIPNMYRDPRGYLYHPHLQQEIPLGTINVAQYGRPAWTFNKIIYSEKKGLFPQLRNAGFPERYDCALMSSEGFASRAVKDLLDLLGDTDEEIHMFCIHDGDSSGTLIYETLQEATLARGARKFKIHNLGLEAWEALEMGLAIETFESKARRPVAKYVRDKDYEDYSDWERWYQNNRVELNAMTTEEFIEWLEGKMEQYGVGKVIPDVETLVDSLSTNVEKLVRAEVRDRILREVGYEEMVELEIRRTRMKVIDQIGNLRERVEADLDREQENHWTKPIEDIAKEIVE